MLNSKLGFHIQSPRYPDWLKRDVARSGAKYVKIINPDAGEARPFGATVKYIGRLHFGVGEPDKELIWQDGAGADAWWQMARPRISRCPWINVWEGPNEPAVENEDRARAFVAFEQCRVEIMHQHGYQVASGVFSTGCPFLSLWPVLGHALADTDFLALHAYGMKTMNLANPLNAWHLLRHRKVVRALEEAGHRVPPIMITETGIDYGGHPQRDGWQAQGFTPQQYRDQIKAYDLALAEDPRVVVATPFTWLHDGWPSFDIHPTMSGLLADYMQSANEGVSLEARIRQDAQSWIVPLNPMAAFEREAETRGCLPAMTERDIIVAGVTYRYQAFRHPDQRGRQFFAYAKAGDWSNVKWFQKEN